MMTISIDPLVIAKNPSIQLEVRRSGNRVVFIGAMDAEEFDRLMANNAHLKDLEDDGHTEAVMTTDGWSG